MAEVSYYPEFGELLPNGNLRVPTAGVSPEGEKWTGIEEIGLGHPNYERWLDIIVHKEQRLAGMSEELRRGREERRRAPKERSEGERSDKS